MTTTWQWWRPALVGAGLVFGQAAFARARSAVDTRPHMTIVRRVVPTATAEVAGTYDRGVPWQQPVVAASIVGMIGDPTWALEPWLLSSRVSLSAAERYRCVMRVVQTHRLARFGDIDDCVHDHPAVVRIACCLGWLVFLLRLFRLEEDKDEEFITPTIRRLVRGGACVVALLFGLVLGIGNGLVLGGFLLWHIGMALTSEALGEAHTYKLVLLFGYLFAVTSGVMWIEAKGTASDAPWLGSDMTVAPDAAAANTASNAPRPQETEIAERRRQPVATATALGQTQASDHSAGREWRSARVIGNAVGSENTPVMMLASISVAPPSAVPPALAYWIAHARRNTNLSSALSCALQLALPGRNGFGQLSELCLGRWGPVFRLALAFLWIILVIPAVGHELAEEPQRTRRTLTWGLMLLVTIGAFTWPFTALLMWVEGSAWIMALLHAFSD